MASISENERQIAALWAQIDLIKEREIEKEKQEAIEAAVDEERAKVKTKDQETKERNLKLIWIPIIFLILSNIFSWLFNILPGGIK